MDAQYDGEDTWDGEEESPDEECPPCLICGEYIPESKHRQHMKEDHPGPRQISSTTYVMTEKTHKVKLLSKDPFCASVPSEMLMECDTWTLKPFQEKCKKGHTIEYVEEKQ